MNDPIDEQPSAARTSIEDVVAQLAESIGSLRLSHPTRVAVDGITASGKTTFARLLTAAVAATGRPATHVSMDGFHHRRAHRQRQGRLSAVGYYNDAYDFDAVRRELLEPLGPGGDQRYRTLVMDLTSDEHVESAQQIAPPIAVFVVDGSFLQRLELDGWAHPVLIHLPLDALKSQEWPHPVARDRWATASAGDGMRPGAMWPWSTGTSGRGTASW